MAGRSGSAGNIWEVCRLTLILLEGREVGREIEPSRSGSAVGFARPGGIDGVDRLLSRMWPSNPGGMGGVERRDSSSDTCLVGGRRGGKFSSVVIVMSADIRLGMQ